MPTKNGNAKAPRKMPTQGTLESQAIAAELARLLKANHVTAYVAAKDIDVSHSQLYEMIAGDRNISATMALKLGRYFDVDPEALLGLQIRKDLAEAMAKHGKALSLIVPVKDRTS